MSFGYSAGDFIAALEIIHRVTKKVASAPKEYQRIRDEVTILGLAIREVATVAASASASTLTQSSTPAQVQTVGGNNNATTTSASGPSSVVPGAPPGTSSNTPASTSHPLQQIARSCLGVLVRLERELDEYADLGTATQGPGPSTGRKNNPLRGLVHRAKKGWHRFRFDPEEITKVRVQLVSHLQSFNTVQINENSLKITSIDQGVGHLLNGQQQASQSINSINQEIGQVAIRQQSDSQVVSLINRGVNEISLESRNQASAINTIHGHLSDKAYKEQRDKILDWISPIDYSDTHQDILNRQQPGTGEWFLNSTEYQTWLNGSPGAGWTLFCPGIPGAGKTMLTAIAIDHLTTRFGEKLDDYGIAYIYFSYQKEGSQTELDLLASLLRQFAELKDVFPNKLEKLYKKCTEKRNYRPNKAQLLDSLDMVTGSFSRVFIVMDALDECNPYVLEPLLKGLFALQERRRAVSLFATSRFIPKIQAEFERRSALSIEVRASEEDVRRYLEGQMDQLRDFALGDKDLQRQIMEKIVESVQGMFLLAQLHFHTLRARETKKAVLQTLAKLESGSNAYAHAYEQAMKRIKDQEEDAAKLGMRALAWITCAKRPLSTLELQHALAVEEDEDSVDENGIPGIDRLVSRCAGLVTVDEHSGIIRLVHYTTQEYFQREKDRWFPDAETEMAEVCLRYISFPGFDSGFCWDFHEYEERKAFNPLYHYAASHWGHHLGLNWVACKKLLEGFRQSESKVTAAAQVILKVRGYPGGVKRYKRWQNRDEVEFNSNKLTGLHVMTYFGLHGAIEFFLDSCWEGNPDAERNGDGQTLLVWAAIYGHPPIAKMLVERGADIEAKDMWETSPLWWASLLGHVEIVEFLIERGAKHDVRHSVTGYSPIMAASMNGHREVIRALLAARPMLALTSQPDTGTTCLMAACAAHHEAAAGLLLDTICSVIVNPDARLQYINQRTRKRQTAVSMAMAPAFGNYQQKLAIAQMLLNAGASPSHGITSILRGSPPICGALESVDLLGLFLKHGASWDEKDDQGRTVLHYLAEDGLSTEKLEILLIAGADINVPDKCGWRPINYALYYHQPYEDMDYRKELHLVRDAVSILLAHGADINARDIAGRTAIIHLARRGLADEARLLISAGADLEVTDMLGQTALDCAVERRDLKMVEILLAGGAMVREGEEDPVQVVEALGEGAIPVGYRDPAHQLFYAGAGLIRRFRGG